MDQGAKQRTGSTGDRFEAWVGARWTDGRVERVSPTDGFYYQACIRPDGGAVLFSGAASGPPRLWSASIEPEVGDPTPLTPPTSGARHGVWSWDGSRIVFSSDRDSSLPPQRVEDMTAQGQPEAGNIFVMAADGGGVQQLTHGAFADQRPAFHPDGTSVVFVSNRDDRIGLWTVAADGSREPTPLHYRGFGYRPWFSVDGHSLYFFTIHGERHRLARIGIEDEAAVLLENDDDGWTHGPFVDPAGEVVIAHSTRGDGTYRLYEVPLDGSELCELEIEGVEHPMHGTRSRNGTVAFDVAS